MKNKAFWIALGVIVLIAILWVAIPEIKKLKAGTTGTGGTGSAGGSNSGAGGSTTGGTSSYALNESKSLYKGVKGPEVSELQRMMNAKQPANPIAVDGDFGSQTLSKSVSLGLYAPFTLAMARVALTGSGNTTSTTTSGGGFWGWFNQWLAY